jgi:limonene-1,2-epoxide hydrolase
MESPIEVVRRFCAAWSDNIGAAELAAFFTDAAVYHNIPLAPVTGRDAIAKTIATFIRPVRARHRAHRVPRHQHRKQMVRS